ncbi:MAG: DNA topoisomerase, partial [Nanoarchaeota archaeon]
MPYELIITEKPDAAKKIAEALADGKAIRKKDGTVSYYQATHGSKDIVVASAVGHLFTVAEENKSFKYPVFDIVWKPSSEVNKKSAFSKKYATVLKKLSKDADSFTVACDYDIEGEVIGLNVIKYICKQKDARRMKFSTLIKEDVQDAYAHASPTIDWGQANAGKTRHELDWLYGINLSRALTLAIRKAGRFKILSAGRVQGPALKIIVDKEKEIRAFVSEPYWQLLLHASSHGAIIEAMHEKDKFTVKDEAQAVHDRCKGKPCVVGAVDRNEFSSPPPLPFNLGGLQT